VFGLQGAVKYDTIYGIIVYPFV